jgi:hypothetical protein
VPGQGRNETLRPCRLDQETGRRFIADAARRINGQLNGRS